MMVLFGLLQQNNAVDTHLMLKEFTLQLNEAGTSNWFDILNLNIINRGPAIGIT